MSSGDGGRVFVVGIDGASWNIADRLIAAGRLPNISRLKQTGAHGDLESTIPFITTPAWRCYSTGMDPSALGVYHWFAFDKATKSFRFNTAADFTAKNVWDWLGDIGKRSVVINMPQTYPVRPINGAVVAGIPAMNWSEYTWPRELKSTLTSKFGYRIIPEHHYLDPRAVDEVVSMVGSRFGAALHLLAAESPDFLHVTVFNVDAIQHYYYSRWDDGTSDAIPAVWDAIDRGIGELTASMDPGRDHLFLVSDHGSARLRKAFHLNHWLEAKGYLRYGASKGRAFSLSGALTALGIPKETVARIFMKLGALSRLLFPAEKVWKTALSQEMPDSRGEQGIAGRLASVDWAATKCVCIGEGLIYVVDRDNRESVVESLKSELSGLADPESGSPAAHLVSFGDVYSGSPQGTSPDLILVPEEGYLVTDHLNRDGSLWSDGGNWSGFHRRAGLFLLWGPGVRAGHAEGVKIYDVAPTILALSGAEPPKSMRGRVLQELFASPLVARRALEAGTGQGAPAGVFTPEDEAAMLESLKKLGYA